MKQQTENCQSNHQNDKMILWQLNISNVFFYTPPKKKELN